jgi:hypothetical protein
MENEKSHNCEISLQLTLRTVEELWNIMLTMQVV